MRVTRPENEETRLNSTVKQLLMWVLVITGAICLFTYVSKGMGGPKEPNPSYTEVLNKATAGQVKDVTIDDRTVVGHYTTGEQFHTTIPANDPEMYTIGSALRASTSPSRTRTPTSGSRP